MSIKLVVIIGVFVTCSYCILLIAKPEKTLESEKNNTNEKNKGGKLVNINETTSSLVDYTQGRKLSDLIREDVGKE